MRFVCRSCGFEDDYDENPIDIIECGECSGKMYASDCCEDRQCEFYGKKLVDLGDGYPVCRSGFVRRYPIPMDPKYKGFDKYYEIVKCNQLQRRQTKEKMKMICQLHNKLCDIVCYIFTGDNSSENMHADEVTLDEFLFTLFMSMILIVCFFWMVPLRMIVKPLGKIKFKCEKGK